MKTILIPKSTELPDSLRRFGSDSEREIIIPESAIYAAVAPASIGTHRLLTSYQSLTDYIAGGVEALVIRRDGYVLEQGVWFEVVGCEEGVLV